MVESDLALLGGKPVTRGSQACQSLISRAKRIWVAGHRGMVGSAIVRRLAIDRLRGAHGRPQASWISAARARSSDGCGEYKPDAVFVAAATVGGILANDTRPAEFLYDNLAIETNIIEASYRAGVAKLLFLGSSCIYPRLAPQPMREDALLTGPLEPTNQWYAIAKIAGIKMCQAYRRQYGCDFISAMPTNLYGPGDNYDLVSSHVVAALIAKAHARKAGRMGSLVVWGSGNAVARIHVCGRRRRRPGFPDGELFRRGARQYRRRP